MRTSEESYRPRHAAPRCSAAPGGALRRVACRTAVAVAVGAVPLACAGASQATASPLGELALPLDTLSQRLSPHTQVITGLVVRQTAPLVGGLHQVGLPTVGDVTGQISRTALPGVGPVGGLTTTLPVTTALGPNSPVTGALNNIAQL